MAAEFQCRGQGYHGFKRRYRSVRACSNASAHARTRIHTDTKTHMHTHTHTHKRRCQAPALRRARHPERGGGNVTRVSSYVRRPFPSKENRRISGRDDLVPPFVPGSGDWFGIPKPRESGSVIGAYQTLLCVAAKRATRPNGEWRYSTRRHVLEP